MRELKECITHRLLSNLYQVYISSILRNETVLVILLLTVQKVWFMSPFNPYLLTNHVNCK